MNTNTTRRALLAGIPAAAVAAAVPAVAIDLAPDRSEWEAVMRAFLVAKSAADGFEPVWHRTHDAWEAGKPSMDGIHWREFWPAYHHPGGRVQIARVMDLEKAWTDFLAGEGKVWFGRDPEATKARHRAALDSVQAFRDAETKHNRESGMDEADAHMQALDDRLAETRDTLMAMAAPDLAALRLKLDYLTDDGTNWPEWSDKFVTQTMADIARLLPLGR